MSRVINRDGMIETRSKIHPLKFGLWIAMGSICMMFAAFTSAYVVRQSAGNWLEYPLPNIFYFSTIVLLLSSFVFHTAVKAYKSGNESQYKALLLTTFILGI